MNDTSRDPVCGMPPRAERDIQASHEGRTFYFCSEYCKAAFLRDPQRHSLVALDAVAASRETPRIAYFSMEVAVDSRMPTYSGGLGVLAGDTLRSCADLKVPIVGVSLLHRKGYFDQHLDEWGNQQETSVSWEPSRFLCPLPATVNVTIEHRRVALRAWEYRLTGTTGYSIPVLFLDADLEHNAPQDRQLTANLYGGDERCRLAQEIILGIGGIRMLRALGHTGLERFHLNEGHSGLLALELLREQRAEGAADWDFERVRNRCIFTTHTPVAAGHDAFPYDLAKDVLGEPIPFDVLQMLCGSDRLNMTALALNASCYVNGVAKRHGEVSREMFPGYAIDSITDGVHSQTWTCDSFRRLYNRTIPGWTNDPFSLRYAISIPGSEIWQAHLEAKQALADVIQSRILPSFRTDAFTIGLARRATAYKRPDLVFSDPSRLVDIADRSGPLQFVFAGKAHPKDEPGKELIRRVHQFAKQLRDRVTIVYLPQYDMELAKLMTAGVDLWLNTPLPPLEASGTSGMKAAHNGVPSLSILDGWWIEGHIEGVTGWSIGSRSTNSSPPETSNDVAARCLYDKLGTVIVPMFYDDRERWLDVMRHTIAINASFFNSHRMVQQYVANAYL